MENSKTWSFYLHVGRHNIEVDGKVVGQIWTKEDAARVCDAMNAQTKVTFPNPEAKKINDALGIPDERHEEIVEALLRAYESAPDAFKMSHLIKDTLDMVNITSANEALYLGMLIGSKSINRQPKGGFIPGVASAQVPAKPSR